MNIREASRKKAKSSHKGVKILLAGNILYLKKLVEKYGEDMCIGKVVEKEFMEESK